MVFAYATHSTAMGPHNYLVSGDVHGLAAQFLEKYLEGGVVAPAFAGASGDIDPWVRMLPKFHTEKGWIPEAVLMGTMLGEEVASVLDGIKKPCPSGPIKTAFKTLALPAKQRGSSTPPPAPSRRSSTSRWAAWATWPWSASAARSSTTSARPSRRPRPFRHTLIITHCNGAAGYLPTKEACPHGGYGVDNSPFAPEAAEEVVKEAVRAAAGTCKVAA